MQISHLERLPAELASRKQAGSRKVTHAHMTGFPDWSGLSLTWIGKLKQDREERLFD
jgi:hypothetical protein